MLGVLLMLHLQPWMNELDMIHSFPCPLSSNFNQSAVFQCSCALWDISLYLEALYMESN